MSSKQVHFTCLDLLRFTWRPAPGKSEGGCGTLLEVWSSGGVLHTDDPIPKRTPFKIFAGDLEIDAKVSGSEHDEFGYYIRFAVSSRWFPSAYRPAYLSERESDGAEPVRKPSGSQRPAGALLAGHGASLPVGSQSLRHRGRSQASH